MLQRLPIVNGFPWTRHIRYNYVDAKGNRFGDTLGLSRPPAINSLFGLDTGHVAVFENLAIFTKISKAQYMCSFTDALYIPI